MLLLGALLCVAWTLIMGKDLNWDLLNYHYYLPYSFLNDRLTQDYFPANTQSYLNPLAYVPLYLLDRMGLHSAVSLSIMAVIHSLNIFILYKICAQYAKDQQKWPLFLALAVGLLTQPFWLEVGNSFIDITTSIPLLAAIYLLGQVNAANARKYATIAGLLFGLAAGLKPTNAVVAVPGILFLFAFAGERKFSALVLYIAFGALGLLVSGGYWAYRLYDLFGNPIFPLYNGIFKSPYFIPENLASSRFSPTDPLGTLLFPFRMLLIQPWTYIEHIAPDIRFALTFPLLLTLPLLRLVPGVKEKLGLKAATSLTSRQKVFLIYFLLIFYLWVITSANGRYGIPQLVLIGPVLLIVVQHLFSKKLARSFLLLILIIQTVLTLDNLRGRWARADWSPHLFEVEMPELLRTQPHLILSTTGPSNSYLATSMHPDTVLVNVRGQYILTLDGAGGDKLASLLKQHEGKIRSFSFLRPLAETDGTMMEWIRLQEGMFVRYGLTINRQDCVLIRMRWTDDFKELFVSCRLDSAPEKYQQFVAESKPVDAVLDKIEASCPRLFSPKHTPTEHQGALWKRHYLNSEVDLLVEDGYITVTRFYYLSKISLGHLRDWEGDKMPPGVERLCEQDLDRTTSISRFISGENDEP